MLIFTAFSSFSDDLESDTIRLAPVTINGTYYHKFSAGSRIAAVDMNRWSSDPAVNLDELIRSVAPVYFKSYGNGEPSFLRTS